MCQTAHQAGSPSRRLHWALGHKDRSGCVAPQPLALFYTHGNRHAETGHPVKRIAGDFGFDLLIGQSPGVETPTDDGLVAIHRRLHEAASAVSATTLPPDPAVLLHRTQMLIALRRAALTQDGCRSGRND